MKHTSGTWCISKLATPAYAPEFGIYAEGSERDLARVVGDNSAADAALIAAAPTMKEALEKIAAISEFDTSSMGWVVDLAKAALNTLETQHDKP